MTRFWEGGVGGKVVTPQLKTQNPPKRISVLPFFLCPPVELIDMSIIMQDKFNIETLKK
jgi:hypothetical protein